MKYLASSILVATIAVSACSSDDTGATSPEPATTATPATTPPTAVPSATSPPTTVPPTTEPPATASPTTVAPPTTAPSPEDSTAEIAIDVYEGQVEGDQAPAVKLGTPVRIVVAADVSDEVHVHGYDLFADVSPESDAVIEFTADVPGIFEVELEGQGLELIRLEVS